MAHSRLFPKPGRPFLSPAEVIERLEAAFRHVVIDPERGQQHASRMIAQLERMQGLTPPPASPAQIERLRSVVKQAVFVAFSDEMDPAYTSLEVTVIPGEPLFFGYRSPDHEEATRPLLERCASVLDYDIE